MTSSPVGRPRTAGRLDLPDRLIPRPRKLKGGRIVVYWYWLDPRDGVEKPLQCPDDRTTAIRRAIELNSLVAQQMADEVVSDLISPPLATAPGKAPSSGHNWGEWCVRYLEIIATTRNLADNTLKSRRAAVKRLRLLIGEDTDLHAVTVETMATALNSVRGDGKLRWAQALRSTAIDMMDEAKREGWFPADRANPADLTRNPVVPVNRSRLILHAFRTIVAAAEQLPDAWIANSHWLGLLSAQRREDVVDFRFRRSRDWEGLLEEMFEARHQKRPARRAHPYPHVHDDLLWVVQQKTGKLLMIPLELRLEAVGMSLGEAIARCRDNVASPYLLHHTRRHTMSKPGDQVFIDTVSKGFARARDLTDLTWAGTPPTYHEIRSLAARLYTEERGAEFAQGLLGHSDPRTTATYRDTRGHEWLQVKAS
jgi:integrase